MTFSLIIYTLFPQIIEAEQRSSKKWELSSEGQEIAQEGSQEARVYYSIPKGGLAQSELMVSVYSMQEKERR